MDLQICPFLRIVFVIPDNTTAPREGTFANRREIRTDLAMAPSLLSDDSY